MVKKRCVCCNKKVGLLGFNCRCLNDDDEPNTFCAVCRIPRVNPSDDGHDCNFDYKELGRQEVEKNNPTFRTYKIANI
jgi:hypothetical protein